MTIFIFSGCEKTYTVTDYNNNIEKYNKQQLAATAESYSNAVSTNYQYSLNNKYISKSDEFNNHMKINDYLNKQKFENRVQNNESLRNMQYNKNSVYSLPQYKVIKQDDTSKYPVYNMNASHLPTSKQGNDNMYMTTNNKYGNRNKYI
ncbi:MAG: hypothetical protein IJ848_02460 [Alphaproteobacteria bacterium]|nr:hypothetical protein [Alphaproteobacteria bacterium]